MSPNFAVITKKNVSHIWHILSYIKIKSIYFSRYSWVKITKRKRCVLGYYSGLCTENELIFGSECIDVDEIENFLLRKVPSSNEVLHPPIYYYTFNKCLASAYTSGIVLKGNIAIPDHINLGANSDFSLLTTSNHFFSTTSGEIYSFMQEKAARYNLDECVLIGGPGSDNWYHFMIEYLPKLFLAIEKNIISNKTSVIVPFSCKTIPAFSEALEVFAKQRNIIYLRKNEFARCSKLIVIGELSITPYNLPKGEWPKINQFSLHKETIIGYSKELRKRLSCDDAILKLKPKKIFLLRDNKRRSYNQDSLMSIASEFGFVGIKLENYTLLEQRILMRNASHVIGASGAAWTSLIFADSNLRCLSWLPREFFGFASYSLLAKTLGHKIYFIEYLPNKAIKSTGQVYTQSYKICESDFRDALSSLILEEK